MVSPFRPQADYLLNTLVSRLAKVYCKTSHLRSTLGQITNRDFRMLQRVELIQGVGLLHDANGRRHKCEKVTLIYADNGRGKSTFASILRSVTKNDPSIVSAIKTID